MYRFGRKRVGRFRLNDSAEFWKGCPCIVANIKTIGAPAGWRLLGQYCELQPQPASNAPLGSNGKVHIIELNEILHSCHDGALGVDGPGRVTLD